MNVDQLAVIAADVSWGIENTYRSKQVRPRNSAISGKGPQLSTCRRELADKRRPESEDDRHDHDHCSSPALGRIEKDDNEWREAEFGGDFSNVADAKNQCDGHDEGEDRIRCECCEQRVWNRLGSVFCILRCAQDQLLQITNMKILSSLLMCTELSYPTKTLQAVRTPTRVAPAADPQPPPSVKVKRTSEALPRGDVVHNVITMANQETQ